MINTSRERLIPLKQLPPAAFPGRKEKLVKPTTLRGWCIVGVRGIRLESLKMQGKHYTSIEAWNRFFQAVTAAAKPKHGRTPMVLGLRTHGEQAPAPREDVARLRTEFKRHGEDGSNGKPSTSSVPRCSSAMLEALALERLPHRQLKILLALESLTRDKTPCFLGNRDFARLTAMSVRSLQKALADLVDQLRDLTRRLEESGKDGPFNE